MKSHFILYVAHQETSAKFYARVLERMPSLDVPGMTEFDLAKDTVLGLMPASSIKRLLGANLPDPAVGRTTTKAELYLVVEDAASYHSRAIAHGGHELSALHVRDWGHEVAYSLDLDGHVLAFAQISKKVPS